MVIFPATLPAQPSFHYVEKLTIADGLSNNVASDVLEDGNGFLWIGTSYGLNRYDGTEVVKFFSEDPIHSLANNKINDLELLDPFQIAIATNHGLSILNTRTNTFRNIYFDSRQGLTSYDNMVNTISKDNQGNLWVASLSGVFRLDKSFHIISFLKTNLAGPGIEKRKMVVTKKIISMISGDQLFFSDRGLQIWNHQTGELQNFNNSNISTWPFLKGVNYAGCFKVMGRYLIALKEKRLFIYDEISGDTASSLIPSGLYHTTDWHQGISELSDGWLVYSLDTKGVVYFKIFREDGKLTLHFGNTIHFADKSLRKWTKDNEGNWWIITDAGGLLKIAHDKQLFREKRIRSYLTHSVFNSEISIFYRYRNKFYVASYGDGLYVTDSSFDSLKQYLPPVNKAFQNLMWNIYPYGDQLWIGTGAGLLSFHLNNHKFSFIKIPHSKTLDSFAITTSFVDSHKLVWMGRGAGHGVCYFDPASERFTFYPNSKTAYPFRYPLSIGEDSKDNLWFLSDNIRDLVTWNRKTNQFKIIKISLKNGELNFPTGNLYIDRNDNIWFGMESFGLVRYNISSGGLETYGLDQGLNTDVIYDITGDLAHRLWLATNQGLSRFNPDTKQFVNYTSADGLPEGQYSSRLYYDSLSQRIYAGIRGKAIYFSPADFVDHTSAMNVIITRVFINNKQVAVRENRELKLSPRQNDLTIFFTGINLTNGSQNKYSYKLSAKSSQWIDIGKQRQISFASLNPGNYDFIIRAKREDGNWSPLTDHFSFVISSPFTSTVWFYLSILIFISASIYAWYRYRLNQLVKLKNIRAGISHDLHDEIGSRLTNISMMSLVAKQKESENSVVGDWLERIREESQSVSQSMREIVWNINPDNDSMEEAFPRMLRYTTEMLEAKGIEVNASVANLQGIKLDMEKRRDIFLIFKEAVQNMLKHSNAQQAFINLNVKDTFLCLTIVDNGKGFHISDLPFRNGLEYMKQRAIRRHWDFEIKSEEGLGTTVSLRIKIK